MGTLTSLGHIEKSSSSKNQFIGYSGLSHCREELLYIQNWYADEKKLATLSEYFVRSKSEVIIANMLVEEDVPFVYEDPLYAPGWNHVLTGLYGAVQRQNLLLGACGKIRSARLQRTLGKEEKVV